MTNSFAEFAKAKMIFGDRFQHDGGPSRGRHLCQECRPGRRPAHRRRPAAHALVDFAERHLPIKVGSDIAFLNGVMNVLISENLYDKKFVEVPLQRI